MSFQTISLPEKRPRDAAQLKKKLPLHSGLAPYYFFGVFALIAPFFPAIALAVNGKIPEIGWAPLIFSFLSAETIAFLLLNFANRSYLKRLKAFTNGIPIKAVVTGHSKTFVFWKSSRNSVLHLKCFVKGKEMETKFHTSNPELHSQFPLNSEIIGLFDPETESLCFPPEIGLILESNKTVNPAERR